MKQGWIQVTNNGTKEPLAPKTMADMVYVDEAQSKTVKAALAEGFVAVFTHTTSVVNGKNTHNFEGPSGFKGLGRAKITTTIQAGDPITVNGLASNASRGGESVYAAKGYWETFVVDGTNINFKSGGAERNYRVIAVGSAAALPTTATENTFAIITTTTMGSRARFAATQPISAVTGDVWIRTFDAHRRITVNMSKRDVLYVYPVGVRQYSGSAWVNKNARIYQGGNWKELTQYLYNVGTFVVAGTDETRFSSVIRDTTQYTGITQAGAPYPYAGVSWTVDLTNVNNVCAEMASAQYSGEIRVFTLTGVTAATKITSQSATFAIYSLDVSALKGQHKVYVGTAWDGTPAGYKQTSVKNVYLT